MDKKGIVSRFEISGMHCASCASNVEDATLKVQGVHEANVNLLTNSMRVVHDDLPELFPMIEKAVQDRGFHAKHILNLSLRQIAPNTSSTKTSKKHDMVQASTQNQKKSMIASISLSAAMMLMMILKMAMIEPFASCPLFEHEILYALTSLLLVIPIIVLNRIYFIRGFKTLFSGNATMDSLIALGCTASFLYSLIGIYAIAYSLSDASFGGADIFLKGLYFDSVAMILTLVSVGKYFESRARAKTSKAFEKLASVAPAYAYKVTSGKPDRIPVEQIGMLDMVMVKKGDSIPVDGLIVKGEGSINEAMLTGEPIPREVKVGDSVYAGTINCGSVLYIEAHKVAGETMIDQIVELLYDANTTKAPIQQLSDKIARIFVPAVLIIAVATFIAWFFFIGHNFSNALIHAVNVLVISCPCALGLATPTAIMAGTGISATQGILFKSAEALQQSSLITKIFFDKTGTITQGHPSVSRFFVKSEYDKQTILNEIFTLESLSSHPLSHALCNYMQTCDAKSLMHDSFKEISGKGIRGKVEGRDIVIGNKAFARDMVKTNADLINTWAIKAVPEATMVFIVQNGEAVGYFEILDSIKSGIGDIISRLHADSIKTCLLTGDNETCAQEVSKKVGIDTYYANILPIEKGDIISDARLRDVSAMVGDGVNDALALARADVGIAIRSGNDIALEAGDVILMNNDLGDVVNALDISKKTMRIIKQNLFWALIYNTLCIPIACGALDMVGISLNPMIAALAMSLSSLCVVSNALRLYSWRPSKNLSK